MAESKAVRRSATCTFAAIAADSPFAFPVPRGDGIGKPGLSLHHGGRHAIGTRLRDVRDVHGAETDRAHDGKRERHGPCAPSGDRNTAPGARPCGGARGGQTQGGAIRSDANRHEVPLRGIGRAERMAEHGVHAQAGPGERHGGGGQGNPAKLVSFAVSLGAPTSGRGEANCVVL